MARDSKGGGSGLIGGKKDVRNWYADRYQRVLVQRNIMALVTLIALVVVLFSTISVAKLTPLKSVQPFLIQVDERSGLTQVVDPLTSKQITADESVRQYFVAQYVRARESYDIALYQYYYDTVRLMSETPVFSVYRKLFDPENTNSFINKGGRELRRQVELKSITFLNETTAQVRITVNSETPRSPKTQEHFIVLLNFDFVKLDLPLKDRYINPLGFVVSNYRVDGEYVQ